MIKKKKKNTLVAGLTDMPHIGNSPGGCMEDLEEESEESFLRVQ